MKSQHFTNNPAESFDSFLKEQLNSVQPAVEYAGQGFLLLQQKMKKEKRKRRFFLWLTFLLFLIPTAYLLIPGSNKTDDKNVPSVKLPENTGTKTTEHPKQNSGSIISTRVDDMKKLGPIDNTHQKAGQKNNTLVNNLNIHKSTQQASNEPTVMPAGKTNKKQDNYNVITQPALPTVIQEPAKTVGSKDSLIKQKKDTAYIVW